MTGFARAEGSDGSLQWTWEIRSVNGRGLDVRCRLPAGMDSLDLKARKEIAARLRRGNVNLTLSTSRTSASSGFTVNRELLEALLGLAGEYAGRKDVEPARLDGLLAFRGVIEPVEQQDDEETLARREELMLSDLERVVDDLARARAGEGARLHEVLRSQLDEMERLRDRAAGSVAAQPGALRARLRALVEELLETSSALSADRLAQEAALLATKADVREELDRLAAHVASARDLLEEGGSVGRRLDFLCQELNREANTLCSKSADVELTRLGLDLKVAVEQFREQVQNVE